MKHKLVRTSTVALSLNTLLKGQLAYLNKYYDVIAVSGFDENLEELKTRENIKVYPINMERHISIFKDIISLFKLFLYFKKEKPLIVHSMTPKAGLLSMLAARLANVPIRIHTFTGLIFPTKTGLMQKVLIKMDQLLCWAATNIYPEGNGVKEDLISYKITNKPLKILANGNVRGVNMKWYNKTKDVIEEAQKIRFSDSFTFCFVGRLVSDKGINELIFAFDKLSKLYKHVRLFLVGGLEDKLDPLSKETKTTIKNNPQIIEFGNQSDVRPFLAASDAFVLPSYREGFPNSVLEAGALSLPSIVTNINGSNEIIIDGLNGEIIPSKDKHALYSKMKEWVEQPEKVQIMGSRARNLVETHFEQNIIWNALLDEYKRLTKDV